MENTKQLEQKILDKLKPAVAQVNCEPDGKIEIVFRNGFRLVTDRDHWEQIPYYAS